MYVCARVCTCACGLQIPFYNEGTKGSGRYRKMYIIVCLCSVTKQLLSLLNRRQICLHKTIEVKITA